MDVDEGSFAGIAQMLASQCLNVGQIASECRRYVKSLKTYVASEAAAAFGVLLTVPELQSNCIRLEALAHLAVTHSKGNRIMTDDFVRQGFSTLGKTHCARMEDPAEDVFVSNIATPRGNFRVLEGVWESAGFHLQRVVNLIEEMPKDSSYDIFRDPVYALLKLSDAVCERAGLIRFMLGGAIPSKVIPPQIKNMTMLARKRLFFTRADVTNLDIDPQDLTSFYFDFSARDDLSSQVIGHTLLERYPLSYESDGLFVMLPTAISAAIRRYVYECADVGRMRDQFVMALAAEFAETLSNTPLMGLNTDAPIEFHRMGKSLFANVSIKADEGRQLHLLFLMDTLEDFENGGLVGRNPDETKDTAAIEMSLNEVYESASKQEGFRDGISLIVGCGIGRLSVSTFNWTPRSDWKVEHLSAADLVTLSWSPGITPLILWRVTSAREKLSELNVTLQNINGLLNLIAWGQSQDGHLVPHGELPDEFADVGQSTLIAIDQTSFRELRHNVAISCDVHMECDVSGVWREVRKEADSLYPEDSEKTLYVAWERSSSGTFPAVYVSKNRTWWCNLQAPNTHDGHNIYQRWRMVSVWLSRSVPALEQIFTSLPDGPILWIAEFLGDLGQAPQEVVQMSAADARKNISSESDKSKNVIKTVATPDYELSHFNIDNVAERALVGALVDSVMDLTGETLAQEKKEELVNKIVGHASARMTHAIKARHYRDFVRNSNKKLPVKLNRMDDGELRLGLGWRVRDRSEGANIEDKVSCIAFLNRLVRHLEDELCVELRKFNRARLIRAALRNIERASIDKDLWKKTAAANMSLHERKEEALAVMAKHDSALNAVSLDCRIVLEIAICESPIEGGLVPGKLDLSRLMAKAGLIVMFGGWSDAIRWDVMEPVLRVTPLGDVHGRVGYIEEIIDPFGRAAHDKQVEGDVKDYGENLEDRPVEKSIEGKFDAAFIQAWNQECGLSIDDLRAFIERVENLGVTRSTLVLEVRRSELLAAKLGDTQLAPEVAAKAIEFLLFRPRQSWRDIPDGYTEQDIQPWRFRRRLSPLRKPLFQVTTEDDPVIFVAPGFLIDAWMYMFRNYYEGDFPSRQLSPLMKSWAGKVADDNGKKFNAAVCKRMSELGWKAESEVMISKLLRMGFDRNYGDVDVLAWDETTGRVLVIECKDLQYKKTYGEIAEQLSDFRGEIGPDGKPDHLLRHLDRVDLIRQHLDAVKWHLKIPSIKVIESHLIFKNPVPVEYALKHMHDRVVVHSFGELGIGRVK